MIPKSPRTLIFRYLALYSISRYLCGHFVLSNTEHGVVCYFHTRDIKGPRLETRRSKVICPVPSETQSSVRHPLGVRRGMHGVGQVTLPATTARHSSINARTDAERDKREVRFLDLGGIRPCCSWILAYVELERIKVGQHFQI